MELLMAGIVAATFCLLASRSAHADYMNWSYQWSLTSGPNFPRGFSNIPFALFPPGPGGSSIPVGVFSSDSVAPGLDSFNASYDLGLTILDKTTHDTGTLSFHGMLSGTIGMSSSTVTNVFTNPIQSLTLDGHIYRVTVDSGTVVNAPSGGLTNVNATVLVSPAPSFVPPTPAVGASDFHAQAPQPSAILLVALGSCCLVVKAIMRRRAFGA
jgi:hypothetical protein